MIERRGHEQYFFDAATVERFCGLLAPFERPVLICAPMLGREWTRRGRSATILDIDARFADVPGFVHWDIRAPRHLSERFDVIVCDPPFFNVSLRQLRTALEVLSHHDPAQRLAVTYLRRRGPAFTKALAQFGLRPTGMLATYATVDPAERNAIEVFANFDVGR